ncbi:MAG: ATP-grasp ribosomal peptide maturase [Pseudonocardiales bacterium]|nr:ATP-grasp ribosomal peptide maturase [Pseudonocardiales bacterium]
MTVLVLAREFDPTADAVVLALVDRGTPVLRSDLSAFPTQLVLDARLTGGQWTGRLSNEYHGVALTELVSIWNRNPSSYSFPEDMTAEEQRYAYREARLGLGGVLASLDVLWANHPNRCADAIFKPYQWKLATECGLRVANTVITNDPEAVRRFAERAEHGAIVKSLGAASITEEDEIKVAFTRRLSDEDLRDLRSVAVTATTVQEWVPKAFEVRLTVIGQEWFPIAIHASTPASYTDWRSEPSALSYEFVPIPQSVVDGVRGYLARANLAYAGFDFVVRPDDEWVMLEANSGPQFGWLEAATGAPMAAAMADMLTKGAA